MRNDLPTKNLDTLHGSTLNGAATKNEFGGNPAPKEFYDAPDNYDNTHGAAKAIMTVLAASLIAVLLFGGALGGTGTDNISVQISSTSVSFSEITYIIEVPKDVSGLFVTVYNSLTKQERALSPGKNTGTFKGLGEDRTYTLEVVGKEDFGETVYASKKLHTMKRES